MTPTHLVPTMLSMLRLRNDFLSMRVALILLVLLPSVSLPVSAQNGATLASRSGIGELNFLTTARQRGMGNVNVPLLSAYDLSNANPASWASVTNVRLEANVALEYLGASFVAGDNTTKRANVNGLQFALPIDPELGATVVTGFLPLSRTDFTLRGRETEQATGEKYTLDYESRGGVSLIRLGFSLRPISAVQLGAIFNYHFGEIAQGWTVQFDNGAYFATEQSQRTSFNGPTFTFGALYTGIKSLTLGATMTTATALRATREASYSYATHDSSLGVISGDIDLPMRFGFGASYFFSDRLLAAVDFERQDWTDAKAYDNAQPNLTSMQRLGAGVEFVPSLESDAGFFGRAVYRLGVYNHTSYIKVGNESMSEMGFTLGFGFPVGTHSRGDIAFELGFRGKSESATGKETMMRLSLGISASELWFTRRGEDD